jgi:hypothetical protein
MFCQLAYLMKFQSMSGGTSGTVSLPRIHHPIVHPLQMKSHNSAGLLRRRKGDGFEGYKGYWFVRSPAQCLGETTLQGDKRNTDPLVSQSRLLLKVLRVAAFLDHNGQLAVPVGTLCSIA